MEPAKDTIGFRGWTDEEIEIAIKRSENRHDLLQYTLFQTTFHKGKAGNKVRQPVTKKRFIDFKKWPIPPTRYIISFNFRYHI